MLAVCDKLPVNQVNVNSVATKLNQFSLSGGNFGFFQILTKRRIYSFICTLLHHYILLLQNVRLLVTLTCFPSLGEPPSNLMLDIETIQNAFDVKQLTLPANYLCDVLRTGHSHTLCRVDALSPIQQ